MQNRYLPPIHPPRHRASEIAGELLCCAVAMVGMPFFIGFLCIAIGAY